MIWSLVLKPSKYALLCVVPLESLSFVVPTLVLATIALDLKQKLKLFLHSSQEQMAMRSFLEIYSSFV